MLSGKFILPVLFLLFLTGCYRRDSDERPQSQNKLDNPQYLVSKLKEAAGSDVKFHLRGKFVSDSTNEIASGTELLNKKEWGIRFHLFRAVKDSLQKVYETKLLEGSFKESRVEKVSFPNSDHEFIYYNSMNYFMGSAGGEILAYVIDLKDQNIYYAHLVSEPDGKVYLFLSDNEKNSDISQFFKDLFRKDFPTLKITSRDPVLD